MSQYQKGKTNLDFTEATDSEWQWHQLGHMQVCTSLQTDNYVSTPPLSFLQAGCPSCRPTNSVRALKAHSHNQALFPFPFFPTASFPFPSTRLSPFPWVPLFQGYYSPGTVKFPDIFLIAAKFLDISTFFRFAFSAMTLLVCRQEEFEWLSVWNEVQVVCVRSI